MGKANGKAWGDDGVGWHGDDVDDLDLLLLYPAAAEVAEEAVSQADVKGQADVKVQGATPEADTKSPSSAAEAGHKRPRSGGEDEIHKELPPGKRLGPSTGPLLGGGMDLVMGREIGPHGMVSCDMLSGCYSPGMHWGGTAHALDPLTLIYW